MAFFVPASLLPESNEEAENENIRLDLLFLVNAKRMGLSFDELNLFRLRDYLEFSNLYFGEQEEAKPRKATQADIDKFFGRT